MIKRREYWKLGCAALIIGVVALPFLGVFYYDYRDKQLSLFLASLQPGLTMDEVDARAGEYGFTPKKTEVWDNESKQNRESRELIVRVGLDVDYISFKFDDSGKYIEYEGGDIDLELDFITYH